MEIDLTQACVGELNTTVRGENNCPIIYGIGVNTRTGEIFPATFPDKGPDIQLRWVLNNDDVLVLYLFSSFLSLPSSCRRSEMRDTSLEVIRC